MTYQMILETNNIAPKELMKRMSQYQVATSFAVVRCRDKETGESYDDEMFFVEIPSIEKLMEIIDGMKDFTFTITQGLTEPIDEWSFEMVKNDEEEYLYRYPILWIN